jgi:hypothetical protein
MKLLTKAIERRLPALYSTDGQGDTAVVQLKLFSIFSNQRWWATEYDPATRTFFGLVTGGAEDELGYFSLDELQACRISGVPAIERDMYFKPITLGEVREQHCGAPA